MRRVGSHLTAPERDEIAAHNREGLHDYEIAERVGCSLGAVFRARTKAGLRANRAQDRPDTLARRNASIVAALASQGLRPGEATRVAYEIKALRAGWEGWPLGAARILHVLEHAGEALTATEVAAVSGGLVSRRSVLRYSVALRRANLVVSRRTKNPGGGRGATVSEYALTELARERVLRRNANRPTRG